MKNKPAYAITSVDHALHLAQLLQQEGPMQVAQVAERLGVARSTAHRLLSMLVYRDFAERDDEKRYVAGPLLRSADVTTAPVTLLRAVAVPHLQDLVEAMGETANLLVRVGDQIRFVASVECDQVLRVGDRQGRVLPAHLTSGGQALLAALGDREVERLYDGVLADQELARLVRALRLVRQRGFAVNDQRTEKGVTAIGVLVRAGDRAPSAAISLAMPTVRFARERLPEWVRALAAAAVQIERGLKELGEPGQPAVP